VPSRRSRLGTRRGCVSRRAGINQPLKMQYTMKLGIIRKTLAAALLAVGVLATPSSRAAGLLIADGGLGGVLEMKEHDVQVTINNGIAVTKVMETFRNTENRPVEALYTFP